VSQTQRALESVSLATFLIPGGGELSNNLEAARAEYHSKVAQEGKGHSLGGPGAYVFMTLLDALTTELPADNILVVLHQCLDGIVAPAPGTA
jgi:hypothetical protein